MPPFPAIRVISWLPKLRRPDGEVPLLRSHHRSFWRGTQNVRQAERDANGDQLLGKRAWWKAELQALMKIERNLTIIDNLLSLNHVLPCLDLGKVCFGQPAAILTTALS